VSPAGAGSTTESGRCLGLNVRKGVLGKNLMVDVVSRHVVVRGTGAVPDGLLSGSLFIGSSDRLDNEG